MSKSKFVLHAWEKEKLDALVLENTKEYGIKYGRREERKEEIKSSSIKIAKNLFNTNMSIQDISKATGLSLKELKLLKENSAGN